MGKKATKILIFLLLSTSLLHAAKVKSSGSYLNQLNAQVKPLAENLDSLKSILGTNRASKSFVTTDFWGLKPSWYVKGGGANEITTNYPFTNAWLNKYGIWKKHTSNLVRNINGVILTPIPTRLSRKDARGWAESLNIEFNFSPGYRSSDYYKKYVKGYLTSNGVPSSQISNALADFEAKAEAATDLITDKIFYKFDTMYDGIAKFGYLQAYENIAEKERVDIDNYVTPNNHGKIFTEELFTKYDTNLNIKSRKDLNGQFDDWPNKASLFEYYRNSYNLTVTVPLLYFQVASAMNKSQKYNQLNKLKAMLNKKVATGKVKKIKKGKFTVYEDSFNKFARGRIAVDFKSGLGYWQLPIWDKKEVIQLYMKKIKKNTENVNTALKKFLSLSLDETVKKFKNSSSQTNDF